MKTKMKNNKIIWVSALIAVLILCLIWADRSGYFDKGGEVIKTDTVMVSDTLYLRDTITVSNPVPYVVTKVKTDTVYDHSGNEVQLITETKNYRDTLVQNLDTAVVSAQITGINAQLDTVSVIFNRREVINTVEITKVIERKKNLFDRLSVGIGVGYGIGLKNKQFEPFAGIMVSYDLDF